MDDLQPGIMAHDRYRRSLNRATVADLMSLVTGEDTDLINYHEVTNRLKAHQQVEAGTEMVPLDKIVGSVGRYKDFTRTFLPRKGVNEERWSRVDAAMNSLEGVPPIDVFKIGDVYFVRDGNHRLSVARANGLDAIEARVTVVETNIPLTVDDFDNRNKWLIKIEQQDFYKQTGVEQLCPNNQIEFTEPGRYSILLRHIHVHWYLRNLEIERDGSNEWLDWDAAVKSWCRNVYTPVVEAIRRQNLMEEFPNRTEADLYLWIAHHREELSAEYDLAPLSADEAVSTFAEVYSESLFQRSMKGLRMGLFRALGQIQRPLGLTGEEFDDLRARRAAGEVPIGEAVEAAAES